MISRKFIEKVHGAFDELNYREKEHPNYEKFERYAVRTLTHCKELSDAIDAVRMIRFCIKKWKKIEKMFSRKLQLFNEYDYEGNSLISVVSDEEAQGTYYITNGIFGNVKKIVFANFTHDELSGDSQHDSIFDFGHNNEKIATSNGNEEDIKSNNSMFAFGSRNGGFTAFDDGNYYIKYAKMSSVKMKLFDNNKTCLCNIVLSKNLEIFLENNSTQYDIVEYGNCIGIYERSYTDSLDDEDEIDTEKCVADIEWDILDAKKYLGVAKLNVYSPNQDMEMLLLFAASTFLTFQRFKQAQKNSEAAIGYWAVRR